jgi:phospholipid/cholesterol/gamma-HCH transport system substrate-binding protein
VSALVARPVSRRRVRREKVARAGRRGRARFTRLVSGAAAVALGASVLASCSAGSSPYTVRAVFQSAEGLFPGNAVDVLGVPSGSVTSVQPQGDHVLVTMSVNGARSLPSSVHAALATPQVLGEPSIELFPGYTSGPKLEPDSTIPESQTSVPVSTDELLRDLQTYLKEVNPQSLGGAISNIAQDLQGQGQGLNKLISQGAATLNLLATKGTELGQLNGSLAQITGTLRARTSNVATLLEAYDTVANVIASNSGPLGQSITELANTSEQLSELFDPNLQPLQSDISTITQVGRTLDRNLGSLDQGLTSTVSLFAGAGRAYDPVNNWLNLNVPLEPGLTSSVLAGLVRDRLAGICRRVLAHHSTGLTAAQTATLQACGNPASGFFDSLLSVLPNALNSQPPSTTSSPTQQGATPQSLIAQGATQIPGLSPSQLQQLSQVPAPSLSSPTPQAPNAGSTQLNPAPPKSVGSSGGSGGGLGGLLHGLLGMAHFFGSLI